MDEEIDAFLRLPAPRHGVDRFLEAARTRLRAQRRVILWIFGVVGALVIPLSLLGSYGHDPWFGIQMGLGCWAFVALIVGLPAWIYLRQDLTLGRRLLERGEALPVEVTSAGATPSGGTLLRIGFSLDGKPAHLTFRVPIPVGDARLTVGSSLVVLRDDPGRRFGLWLPGHGIVTTR